MARTAGTSTHRGPSCPQPDGGLLARLEGELALAVHGDDARPRVDRVHRPGAHRLDLAHPHRHDQARRDRGEDAAGAPRRPMRAVTPCGSCRATGDSWPRMLDRPIASGSANAQKSWVSVAGSQTARAPDMALGGHRDVDERRLGPVTHPGLEQLGRGPSRRRPGPCR